MDEPPLRIEPLGAYHDRTSFSCGEMSLDHYIRQQACQDARRRVALVFVVAVDNSSAQIAGYYTLSAPSFEKDCLPAEVTKRLPHYPVPGAVVGRLAADLRSQRSGLGEVLLLDAIYRVVCAGDVGIATVAVTAPKDRTAKSCRVLTT